MSVADKLDVARHALSGSNFSKTVCKASSREVMGPKKKHIDCLLNCTENENSNLANLTELLFERCRMSSWVIVSKALVTFHNLMSAGNERFLQHMTSRSTLWNLENFHDKTAVIGYDMSAFIRRYTNFLTQKTKSYTEMNYDFCRAKRGDSGVLRTCGTPQLIKAMAEMQNLLDSLLEVDLQSSEFNNGVVTSAFVLLYKDMIKLFACYNDGVINLLEKYYQMNKEDCKQSLDIYKKFVSRMENVKNFFKVAEDVGVNENVIPELEAPSSLVVTLENHYQSLEEGKAPTPNAKLPNLAPINIPLDIEKLNLAERKVETKSSPEEDQETIAQQTLLQTVQTTQPDAADGPAVKEDSWQSLFETSEPNPKSTNTSSNNDDLLALHAVFEAQQSPPAIFPAYSVFGQPVAFGVGGASSGFQPGGGFSSTQPNSWGQNANYHAAGSSINNNSNPFQLSTNLQMNSGEVLQPMNKPQPVAQQENEPSAGDLHSTLSKVGNSLDNFDIFSLATTSPTGPSGHQWTPAKPKVKTGGSAFQMGTTAGTTLPPTSPISPTGSTLPPTSPVGGMARPQPVVRPAYTQPPMFGVQQQPMMRPQVNMFPQQSVRPSNPFGNPVMDNQALF